MNTCALRAFLKLFNVAHFLMLLGRAFHVRGPLYENEFLKISKRGPYIGGACEEALAPVRTVGGEVLRLAVDGAEDEHVGGDHGDEWHDEREDGGETRVERLLPRRRVRADRHALVELNVERRPQYAKDEHLQRTTWPLWLRSSARTCCRSSTSHNSSNQIKQKNKNKTKTDTFRDYQKTEVWHFAFHDFGNPRTVIQVVVTLLIARATHVWFTILNKIQENKISSIFSLKSFLSQFHQKMFPQIFFFTNGILFFTNAIFFSTNAIFFHTFCFTNDEIFVHKRIFFCSQKCISSPKNVFANFMATFYSDNFFSQFCCLRQPATVASPLANNMQGGRTAARVARVD